MMPSFAIVCAGYPHQAEFVRENLYEHLDWPDLKDNAVLSRHVRHPHERRARLATSPCQGT
jgi:hypothetical protein